MAQQQKPQNPSIIETIDKMVKEGESEEKILQTLKDIGISSDNARRLLILGQADVFSLLKGEIKRKAREESAEVLKEAKEDILKQVLADLKEYEKTLANQSKMLQGQLDQKLRNVDDSSVKGILNVDPKHARPIQEQILTNLKEYEKHLQMQEKQLETQVSEKTKSELAEHSKQLQQMMSERLQKFNELEDKVHKDIWEKNKGFQEELNKRVAKISETEEKNLKKLNQMTEEFKKVQSDVTEVGIKGVGARNKTIGYAVVALGLVFGAGTLYVFYNSLQQPFTVYSLVTMTVMAIITVTLLVIGTLI